MGDDNYCHMKGLLQEQDEFIQLRRNNRVKPGGRLIEHQNFGIKCESASDGAAFFHAAGQGLWK